MTLYSYLVDSEQCGAVNRKIWNCPTGASAPYSRLANLMTWEAVDDAPRALQRVPCGISDEADERGPEHHSQSIGQVTSYLEQRALEPEFTTPSLVGGDWLDKHRAYQESLGRQDAGNLKVCRPT